MHIAYKIAILIIIAWFGLGKSGMYLMALLRYRHDMKWYRKHPQAAPPPRKPTFFNN